MFRRNIIYWGKKSLYKVNRPNGIRVNIHPSQLYSAKDLTLQEADAMVNEFYKKNKNSRADIDAERKSTPKYVDHRNFTYHEKDTYKRQRLKREMRRRTHITGLYHAVRTILWQKTRFRG